MTRAIHVNRPVFSKISVPIQLSTGNVLPTLAALEAITIDCSAAIFQDFAVNTGIIFG